jgi:signal transduction histidine kinase
MEAATHLAPETIDGAVLAGDRQWRGVRRVATIFLATSVLLTMGLAWLAAPMGGFDWLENALFTLIVLIAMGVGVVVSRARPRNPIGYLLLFEALALALMCLTDGAVQAAVNNGDTGATAALATRWAVAYQDSGWPLLFVGFAGIAYVFPDGRTFNRFYRRWMIVGASSVAGFLLVAFTSGETRFREPFQDVVSPVPSLPWSAFSWLVIPLVAGGLFSLFAAAFAVRARLKASSGERRLQMLWLAWAAITIPGTLVLCFMDGIFFSDSGGLLTGLGLMLMAILMPASIGIGILRYRLFDIELVINRTLVYGALTLTVAVVYASIVAGIGALVGSATAAGVFGAVVVAVIVQPLHARLQRRIDRLVYGDRSDPYAALQRLDARLLETQAPGDVVQAVVDSVAESLRLPWSAVEFERGGEGMTIAAHGVRGRGALERRDLWYRGELVGTLAVEIPRGRPLAESDKNLLDQLAAHVGAAVQSVRLTVDLQASRKELITAREEERRRLRRDLHDGVGPSLAAMSLQLDVLRDRVTEDDAGLVDQLGGQVQDAIADIRRLVYELRPPALDQYGLVSALSEQAGRMSNGSARFTVSAPEAMPGLPAAVEVAVYRIALEGMTNAARHSGSSRCDVTIAVNGALEVKVADDGVGIDGQAVHGVGLRSMRERTTELGGDFTISPRLAGGTELCATFPLDES